VDSPPCDAHPYRTPLPTFWVSCFLSSSCFWDQHFFYVTDAYAVCQ
jgi:hypothetical protein